MTAYTGRERTHDLTLTISSVRYPFKVLRRNGVPVWDVQRVADIEGQSAGVEDKLQSYNSFHSGWGWSQRQAPNTYHFAKNMDLRFPGQAIMGPLVTTVTLATTDSTNGVGVIFEIPAVSGYVYVIAGKYANRIDLTNDSLATTPWPYTLASGFVATDAKAFDALVYIATSGTGTMYKFDGTTFTAATDTSEDALKGEYFAPFFVGDGTTNYAFAQNFLSGSTPSVAWLAQGSPAFTPANWAGSDGIYPMGDSAGTITSLVGVERTLFAGRTDGLWFLDGQLSKGRRVIPAIPVHANNGKQMMADSQQRIWYPCQSGVYRYDPASGDIADVSPDRGMANRSGVKGVVTAMAEFRSWIYATVYDGTNSYLMAGREREEGDPGYGKMIWHGYLATWSSIKIQCMLLSAKSSPPRLWFGQSNGSVSYIKLPTYGDNPWEDSTYRYAATGSIYLPADDFGVPGMRWNMSDVVFEAYGLQPDQGTPDQIVSVTPYERRDATSANYAADSGWTALSSAVTTDGRSLTTPTGDKRFNRAEIRLDVANGITSGTTSPVIRAVAVKASRRPTQRDVIRTTLVLSDEQLSRMGIQNRYSANNLLTQLDTLDSYYPVVVTDWWTGKTREQTCLVMPITKRVIQQEGDKAVALAIDCVLKVVG